MHHFPLPARGGVTNLVHNYYCSKTVHGVIAEYRSHYQPALRLSRNIYSTYAIRVHIYSTYVIRVRIKTDVTFYLLAIQVILIQIRSLILAKMIEDAG
jgi:hypothetical protein